MDPKRQRLIATVLGVVTVFIWARGFLVRPTRSRPPTDAQTKTVSPARHVALSPGRADTSLPRTSRFTEWGGNPFEIERRSMAAPAAGGPPTGSPSSYSVSGILWDAKMPSAIVNGRLIGLGDELSGGWKVIEIQKDKVILSDGLTTQTLTVD